MRLFRREFKGGDERRLLTDGTSCCVPDSTAALRRDVDAGKRLESKPRDTLQTLGHRRISVHGSAAMVWVSETQWEKDGKTNLGVFRHLLIAKSATHHPPPHGYVSPVSLTACSSGRPNTVCYSSESCPSSDRALPHFDNYGARRVGHGF